MSTFVPLKLGAGTVTHACTERVTGTRYIAGQAVQTVEYRPVCTVVNTHRINNRVRATPLPEGSVVTCKHCLAIMAKEALMKS